MHWVILQRRSHRREQADNSRSSTSWFEILAVSCRVHLRWWLTKCTDGLCASASSFLETIGSEVDSGRTTCENTSLYPSFRPYGKVLVILPIVSWPLHYEMGISSTIKWEESGVFIFTSADNSWQLVTIWFIIINHCYSWIIPGSQQISLYRFISFLDVTMSHLSQNDKRSCARDTQPPECPSAQNFIMLRKNWAFHFWKVYIGMADNQMWGKWALFRAIWSVHGGEEAAKAIAAIPSQCRRLYHSIAGLPTPHPIPSHGGCHHLKDSEHSTYIAV